MEFILFVGLILMAIGVMAALEEQPHRVVALLIMAVGLVVYSGVLARLASPEFNRPYKPMHIAMSDTLYIVPKYGVNGIAVVVTRDSLGERIVAREFIARQTITIPPAIK